MDVFNQLIEDAKKAFLQNDYIKSNELYNKAVSLNKNETYLHFEIAKNYFNLSQYKEAVNSFNLYLSGTEKQDDLCFYSLLFLAKIYKTSGMFKKALLMCSQAKKYLPKEEFRTELEDEINDIYFLYYEKIPKQLDQDNYLKLNKYYLDKLQDNPENSTAITNLAELYLITRQYKVLVEFIKNNIDLVPDDDVFFKNKLINFLETAQGKTKLLSYPIRLGVNLSNMCNLSCIMCYVKDFKWIFPKERINEIKSYFPYLEKVMWQGGEVFMLDYFLDLIREAAKYKHLQQGIITNAQLLNEEIIDMLLKMNLELTVSFDGVNKKTYETIRQNASFEKLVRNLQYIAQKRDRKNKNFTWGINFVVSRHNDKQLLSLFEIAHRYNVDFVCIMPLKHGDIIEIYDNYAVTKQIMEIKKRNEKYKIFLENRVTLLVESLVKDVECGVDIEEWISYEKPVRQDSMPEKTELAEEISVKQNMPFDSDYIDASVYNKKDLICHIPWQQLILDYDKTYWPDCQCRSDKNKNILNYCDDLISEIWNSKEIAHYREIICNDTYKSLCKEYCRDGKICDNYINELKMLKHLKQKHDYNKMLSSNFSVDMFNEEDISELLFFISRLNDKQTQEMYYGKMYVAGIRDQEFLKTYILNLIDWDKTAILLFLCADLESVNLESRNVCEYIFHKYEEKHKYDELVDFLILLYDSRNMKIDVFGRIMFLIREKLEESSKAKCFQRLSDLNIKYKLRLLKNKI